MVEERTFSIEKQTIKSMCNAVRKKGKTTDLLSIPNGYIDAVNAIGNGKNHTISRDDFIVFYDYDGTILGSCTKEDAEFITYPSVPHHEGLTIAEWNYSLEEIHNTKSPLDVAAIYKINDGRIHLKGYFFNTVVYRIALKNLTDDYGNVIPSYEKVIVNWGDGTGDQTIPDCSDSWADVRYHELLHQYTKDGHYDISIKGSSTTHFVHGFVTKLTGTTIEGGSGNADMVKFPHYAPLDSELEEIWMPDWYTVDPDPLENENMGLGESFLFVISNGLKKWPYKSFNGYERFIGLPTSMTECPKITGKNLIACSLPNSIEAVTDFSECTTLRRIHFPNKVQKIEDKWFHKCECLRSVSFGDQFITYEIINTYRLKPEYILSEVDFSNVKQVPTFLGESLDMMGHIHRGGRIYVPQDLENEFNSKMSYYSRYFVLV